MKQFINIIKKTILYFWLFLTIIVLYFIIQRFVNPNYKGISNVDLKLYLKISIVILISIAILKNVKKKRTNE
jgi:hypothetical protein